MLPNSRQPRESKEAPRLRIHSKSDYSLLLLINCCVRHMVVLYVDSLVVNILVPDFPVRAEACDSKRIGQVTKVDKKLE